MASIQLLAKNMKYLRTASGLKQEELSSVLNLSRQAYSNYENMKRMPDLDCLIRLSGFYRISLDILVSVDLAACRFPLSPEIGISESKNYKSEKEEQLLSLTPQEKEVITDFRLLNEKGQKIVTDLLRSLLTQS